MRALKPHRIPSVYQLLGVAPTQSVCCVSTNLTGAPLLLQVQQKLTMVDDLPHAGDPEQRRRLTELLVQLARSSRFPIAVIVTGSHAQSGGSFGGASKAASFQGWHRVRHRNSPGYPIFIHYHSVYKESQAALL